MNAVAGGASRFLLRTYATGRAQGRATKLTLAAIAYIVIIASVIEIESPVITAVTITAAFYAATAMNLSALIGWAGQPSIMSAALLLFGAGEWVILGSLGIGAIPSAIVVGASGFSLGLVVSLPARRLTGLYLLLSTFVIHFLIVEACDVAQSRTGALAGFFPKPLSVFGVQLGTDTDWIIVSVLFLGLTHLYLSWLRRGTLAGGWRVIKCGTNIASVVGIPVPRALAVAFGVTSGWTALTGMISSAYFLNVSYDAYPLLMAINFIAMVIIGGMGSLGGAIFGAVLMVGLPRFFTNVISQSTTWASLEAILFALIAIGILVFAPQGAAALFRMPGGSRSIFFRTRNSRSGTRRASAVPDGKVIALNEVDVQYAAGEHALRRVSLSLTPGKVHAVLGQNGAGKTTLLQTVAGFPPGVLAHQRGDVSFQLDGNSPPRLLHSTDSPSVRVAMGIALVPAEDKIFRGLTVRQQLDEAVHTGARRLGTKTHAFGLEELLKRFPQLPGRLDAKGYQLSGGERQQLALACALARAPKVLVIDEATLGLSPAIGLRVCESIRDLAAAFRIAVLLAEQNAVLAERVADEATVLLSGSCIYQGPVGASLTKSLRGAYLAAGPEDDAIAGSARRAE